MMSNPFGIRQRKAHDKLYNTDLQYQKKEE